MPARWPDTAARTRGGSATARPRATARERPEISGPPPSNVAGDDATGRAARPLPEYRPQQPARTTVGPEPKPGEGPPGNDPGTAPRAESKRAGSKPRTTRDLLNKYARDLYREHGRLSRDLLEEAVRKDGYSVASDTAGEVVRTVKAELPTAPVGHPH